jgi:hypothetical protein
MAPNPRIPAMLQLLKIAIVVALAVFAYKEWRKHAPGLRGAEATAVAAGARASRFVTLPASNFGRSANVVVLAAEGCSEDAAQRADALTSELSRLGVPVTRAHDIRFEQLDPRVDDVGQINAVMNGTLPVVLVRGRARNNPTLDEVLAEYRQRG